MHQATDYGKPGQKPDGETSADPVEQDADGNLDCQQGEKKAGIGEPEHTRRQREIVDELGCNHIRRCPEELR